MTAFKLCRFRLPTQVASSPTAGVGLLREDDTVLDLTHAGWSRLDQLLEQADLTGRLTELGRRNAPTVPLADLELLPPVDEQEVWAAGVTYLRSKKARMAESEFSADAYDRVYEAERPELFFKALPHKVVGPGAAVGIRQDARWNVPEPELALVLSRSGRLVGYTIGNDMSARDIEGENLLYLPQAKVYDRSCALGPWIVVGPTEPEARTWAIRLEIERAARVVFCGETSVGQIKRRFDELAQFLLRSQSFPHGAVLLTGTGVVPPDDFTLQPGDRVRIRIAGIGTLENAVIAV